MHSRSRVPVRANAVRVNPVTPTAAESFADGTMLELVRVKAGSRLLAWENGRPTLMAGQVNFDDRIFVPMSLDRSLLDAIRFPGSTVRNCTTGELFQKILDTVSKFSGLPARELWPIPYWVLCSWLPEVLDTLPTLVVTGTSLTEVHRFFKILRCLCRRGVLLSELTPAGLLALPMHLRPTILIAQANLSCRLREYLRSTRQRGTYIPRFGGFIDLHCASAVYLEEGGAESELCESALNVSLFHASTNSAFFDAAEEEALAAEFQPLLLHYRFKNFHAVRDSKFDSPGFTAGVRNLARSLGASIVGDPKLTAGINSLLSCSDVDVRFSWSRLPNFAIVDVLLVFIHEKKELRVSVKKLTEFVNVALRARGEIKEYSSVEIGFLLSRLNLPRSRAASGMLVNLDRKLSRRVHDLKKLYGVTTSPSRFPGCPDCELTEVHGDKGLV